MSSALRAFSSTCLTPPYTFQVIRWISWHYLKFLKLKVLANNATFILPKFIALIPFWQIPLPNLCDSLFHPSSHQQLTLYSHLFDDMSTKVLVQNDANYSIQILRYYKLGCLTEIPYKNCFIISIDHDATAILPISSLLFTIPPADTNLEIELLNGIKIYRDKKDVEEITRFVNEYLLIWKSSGFVQVLLEWWMKVYLKSGWESKVSVIKSRVYPLDIDLKRLVSKTFNKI